MKTAIYPGSFDPVTLGHIDVIRRGAAIFDRVIVCVMVNCDKKYMFSADQRADFIKKATAGLNNVEVEFSDGLLAEYVLNHENAVILKGVRNVSDFDMELQMALINRKVSDKVDTVLLPSSSEYMFLSSTAAREMIRYGADLSEFLPKEIINEVKRIITTI